MKTVKVQNMQSSKGNTVPNQFIIHTKDGRYFQSYQTVIAFIENPTGKVYLDDGWNYSRTTSKYRNIFLGETTAETERKIASGEYTVTNLNK